MISAKTFAVVFTALFAHSALATDCTRTYTVKEGDICDGISGANKVSTYQLAVVNHDRIDKTCSNLVPGDQLCLGHSGEDCSETYTVKADDTCEGITGAHSLNSTILSLNNPQIDQECSNIYIGEVLCVAQNVQVPPAPAGELPGAVIPVTATPAVPSATKAPAAAPAPPAPAPTPAPEPSKDESKSDNTDDEDCDDEEDKEDHDDDDDEDDDEDLPFCDEI